MFKLLAIMLVLLSVIAGIVGPQAFFIVDEKQQAIVTRFGDVKQTVKRPGMYLKTPFVDATTYFDKRLLTFDAPPDSLLTKDKKRLIIDVYARGRIVDPKLFRETVQTESQGRARAINIIASELRTEIASDNQAEIITTKREDIMARILVNVKPKLADLGLEMVDVRIKRADFPPEIAESVYARMQAERKRKADKERAEGAEIDAQVRATVDKEATIIRATAQRQPTSLEVKVRPARSKSSPKPSRPTRLLFIPEVAPSLQEDIRVQRHGRPASGQRSVRVPAILRRTQWGVRRGVDRQSAPIFCPTSPYRYSSSSAKMSPVNGSQMSPALLFPGHSDRRRKCERGDRRR